MLIVLLSIGCQSSNFDPLNHVIFQPNRFLDLPQDSEEWWEEEDALSNVFAGAGVLFGDLNGDERLDIVLLRRNGVHIHVQNPNGWTSISYTNLDFLASSGGILDWDEDGDADILFNTVFGPGIIWEQDGEVWYSREIDSPIYSGGSAWYDVNRDGLLDFVTAGYGDDQSEELIEAIEENIPHPGEANYLYIQQSDGTFDSQENFEGLELPGYSFQPLFLPFLQNDQWDMLVINDFGHVNGGHQLYTLSEGEFEHVDAGHGLDVEMYGMGVDATDLNEDQIPDLFIANIMEPILLTSLGDGNWVQSALSYGIDLLPEQEVCWGVDWYDVNNDGHEDLWIGCGPLLYAETDPEVDSPLEQPDALFLWTEDGFVDVASEWGINSTTSTRAGGFVDLNDDGCAELIRVARNGPAEFFVGTCPVENAWLDIELDDGHLGIGATVIVDDGERQQVRWVTAGGSSIATFLPQRVHFGFGPNAPSKVRVEIHWSDGTVSEYKKIDLRQRIQFVKE